MGRGSKIFFIAFICAALVFGLVAFAVISALLKASAPVADPEEFRDGAISNAGNSVRGTSFNLLVMNVDYRPELYSYDEARVNSLFGDTFGYSSSGAHREIELLSAVLVRLDRERAQFTFTPISADTYVALDGESVPLSSIYLAFGSSGVREKVKTITGIEIDEYVTVIPSSAEGIVNALGGLDYGTQVISTVSVEGEVTVKSGTEKLSGKDVRTLLIADYESRSQTRETVAAALIKSFLSELTEDGESNARAKLSSFLPKLQTSLDGDFVAANAGLIGAYVRFEKKDLLIVGEYENGYFHPNVAETIDRFSNYRKYYS